MEKELLLRNIEDSISYPVRTDWLLRNVEIMFSYLKKEFIAPQ